jgi:predicted transcriptional regulator
MTAERPFAISWYAGCMAASDVARATLTIRIDSRLHRSLAAVADAEGASMNSIAEEAVALEVSRRAANLADTYERLAEAMRDRTRPRLAELIDEIADDEASPEPFVARRVSALPDATFEAVTSHARRVG